MAPEGEQAPAVVRSIGRKTVDRQPEAPESFSDERLLAESMAGSDGAFRVLVERYSKELFQFVIRFTRNSEIAEDVVQETFLQVYQSAGSFDSGRSFRPWLFAIAANKARDCLRGSARRREIPLSGGGLSGEGQETTLLDILSDETQMPSEVLEGDEQREVVRALVSQMPDNLREVLILGYYHHLAYKEIAEALSIPLGTVKSRLHAAVCCFAAAYKRAEEQKTNGYD
jgi:RNA polymerase sigma-70 factor (ECF subfamily)